MPESQRKLDLLKKPNLLKKNKRDTPKLKHKLRRTVLKEKPQNKQRKSKQRRLESLKKKLLLLRKLELLEKQKSKLRKTVLPLKKLSKLPN